MNSFYPVQLDRTKHILKFQFELFKRYTKEKIKMKKKKKRLEPHPGSCKL